MHGQRLTGTVGHRLGGGVDGLHRVERGREVKRHQLREGVHPFLIRAVGKGGGVRGQDLRGPARLPYEGAPEQGRHVKVGRLRHVRTPVHEARPGRLARAQRGVHEHEPREPVRHLADDSEADQPAPVLADERDAREPETVQKRHEAVPVHLKRVLRPLGELVRLAEAEEVGREDAVAARERRDHLPIQE